MFYDAKPGIEIKPANESEITHDLIDSIKQISRQRYGRGKMLRFNQAKGLGCFEAEFQVIDPLDDKIKHGVFASPEKYKAKVRFANASKFDDRKKDFRGMSIKLFGVNGQPLWGEPGTQDFILNSHPVLFAATAEQFLGFTRAMQKGRMGMLMFFINPANWRCLWIVLRGRKKIQNPFAIRYWSTTPYRLGPDQSVAVKYSVQPVQGGKTYRSNSSGEDQLSEAMKNHLTAEPAVFDFMVQFQVSPKEMPIENASVHWDETLSPFHKVARIVIKNQDFDSQQSRLECEQISFNPWQSLPEHQPLGGINRVRKAVYSALAVYRQNHNQKEDGAHA